jgi:hypothetical protein
MTMGPVLLLLGSLSVVCDGSHFAYGTINWQRKADGQPWEFTVNTQLAIRTSYMDTIPAEGEAFITGSHDNIGITLGFTAAHCGEPAGCESCSWSHRGSSSSGRQQDPSGCTSSSGETLEFIWDDYEALWTMTKIYNDGYFIMSQQTNFTIPEITIGDWVARESEWWVYSYGYARPGNLNINGEQVCTVDGNDNGFCGASYVAFQMDTYLNPNFEASPVCFGLPRYFAAVGFEWTFDFSLQASHPNQLDMTYSLAPGLPAGIWNSNENTIPNSGLFNNLPGSTMGNPANITLLEQDGIMSWTPSEEGLYMLQVWVTDSNGVHSPIDFFIHVGCVVIDRTSTV